MDNNDVIEYVKQNKALTPEINNFIRKNYEFVDYRKCANDGSNWELVVPEGSDYKYGRYYIDTKNMRYRSSTFDEFYGGGIVD